MEKFKEYHERIEKMEQEALELANSYKIEYRYKKDYGWYCLIANGIEQEIHSDNLDDLKNCWENNKIELADAITRQFNDKNHYGLIFYMSGYDGKAQSEREKFYRDYYNTIIF